MLHINQGSNIYVVYISLFKNKIKSHNLRKQKTPPWYGIYGNVTYL